jgi:hypothetical protein
MISGIKTRFKCIVAIGICYSSILLYSCSKDDTGHPVEEPDVNKPFVITQELLDAATFVSAANDTLIIGNPFNEREIEAQNNFRSIFSNVPKSNTLKSGDIITIINFANENGRPGRQLFVDVMVKRESGFNAEGNDFEYMRIMYDPSVDYKAHPNGILPDIKDTNARGMGGNILTVDCVTCHRKTADFIFYDNK